MKRLAVLFFLGVPLILLSWITFHEQKLPQKPDEKGIEKIESQNPKEIIDSIAQDIESGDFETALSKMVEQLRHTDIPTSQGEPLIVLAAQKNSYELVSYLIDQGCEINAAEDTTGETALIKAVRNGNLEMVIKLLSANANPNIKSQSGVSALTEACARKNETIASYLLSRGAFSGISDENLLSYTFDNNDTGIEIMLRGGANPNFADANGNTPLIVASSQGNLAAIQKLIAYKADVNAANNNGMTPLLYTVKGSYNDAAKFLMSYKDTDINKANNNGQTPLFYAAYYGNTPIAQDLLELGADYNKADKNGATPLMAARSKKHGVTARAISDFIAFKNLPRDKNGNIIIRKGQKNTNTYYGKTNVKKTAQVKKVPEKKIEAPAPIREDDSDEEEISNDSGNKSLDLDLEVNTNATAEIDEDREPDLEDEQEIE